MHVHSILMTKITNNINQPVLVWDTKKINPIKKLNRRCTSRHVYKESVKVWILFCGLVGVAEKRCMFPLLFILHCRPWTSMGHPIINVIQKTK